MSNRRRHAIPDAVLTQHTAILGKTGSGKTSTSKLAVEQVVPQGARVCVLDPIKSDWWGLISSADGTKPGLPFIVLGGPHGHLELRHDAGEAVGRLVADGSLPLSIIDMKDFGPGGHARFFSDFAETLYRQIRGVLYLVIEEAHVFAPKERSGIGQESEAIHYAKMLATAGRSLGIRLILATQRTQALHNALLGSCDTLITHRLTAPADQAPVVKWLKANVEESLRREIEGSISSLPTGTGWICSGEARIFERVAFPRIQTFDNTATPDFETVQGQPVATAKVDVERIRAALTSVSAPIDRPKNGSAVVASAEELVAAEQRGYERGIRDSSAWVSPRLTGFADAARKLATAIDAEISIVNARWAQQEGDAAVSADVAENGADQVAVVAELKAPTAEEVGRLPPARRKILDAIAWAHATGQPEPKREIVAFLCRVSWKSGGYRNNLSALHTAGLIRYPGNGRLALTKAGRAEATPPAKALTHADLMARIGAVLAPARLRVLEAVIASFPSSVSRDRVAEEVGVSVISGGFRNNLSGLSALGLVTYPSPGEVRAADMLFPGQDARS